MEPLGEAANQFTIVCTTNKPSGWDCQDQNLCFLFESIGESQNCTPDLPTICLTVIVKSYVDAAKSRMLVASKIEKSCGVKQAVKWWMWIDMDSAFQTEHSTPELLQKN